LYLEPKKIVQKAFLSGQALRMGFGLRVTTKSALFVAYSRKFYFCWMKQNPGICFIQQKTSAAPNFIFAPFAEYYTKIPPIRRDGVPQNRFSRLSQIL